MKTDSSEENKVVDIAPTVKRVEPVQFTCRMILGKDCDISATTAYYPKEGENPNAVLDQMISGMERQQARHEIKVQEKEIEDATLEMEVNLKDLDGRILKFPDDVKDLNDRLVAAKDAYTSTYNRLRDAKENEGRLFDPKKTGNHSVLNPLLVAVNEIEQKLSAKQHEHDTDIMTTKRGVEITNFRVAKAKAKIEKLLKIINA